MYLNNFSKKESVPQQSTEQHHDGKDLTGFLVFLG